MAHVGDQQRLLETIVPQMSLWLPEAAQFKLGFETEMVRPRAIWWAGRAKPNDMVKHGGRGTKRSPATAAG